MQLSLGAVVKSSALFILVVIFRAGCRPPYEASSVTSTRIYSMPTKTNASVITTGAIFDFGVACEHF